MKKIIYIIGCVVILGLILSSIFLYSLGDKIIEMGLEQELKKLDVTETSIDKANRAEDTENPVNKESENQEDTEGSETGEKLPHNSDTKAIEQNPNKKTETPAKEKEAPLTASKIEDIKKSVTIEDKMKASTLVVKRLSLAEIKQLSEMLGDGITKKEKDEAKKLVYSKFEPEEAKEIKELYKKYLKQEQKK